MADDLVLVFTTRSAPEGEIVRSLLADAGISVLAKGLDDPYRMAAVDVFVPASQEVQARLVLAETTDAPIEADVEDALGET